MFATGLKCLKCGATYPHQKMFEGCPRCKTDKFSANLKVEYDYDKIAEILDKDSLRKRVGGVWKYQELLPVKDETPKISLGEGDTPLIRCRNLGEEIGLKNLYVKDESRNPTSAHKDRMVCVGTSKALEFGAKILVAGGGNTGASTAAHAARAGLKALSFEVPDESPTAMLQTMAFGGMVIPISGYEGRYELMRRCVEEYDSYPTSIYDSPPTGDPYGKEGYKSIGYEVSEQLGWKAPDWVINPAGQGFNFAGTWAGFQDFHRLGLIDELPSMVAAQSGNMASLARAVKKGLDHVETVERRYTIARHAASAISSYSALRAVKDSQGDAVGIGDGEITNAVRKLAKLEGIFAGTTSATTVAVAEKLREEGKIDSDEVTVCLITQDGMKDIDILERSLPRVPESIQADWSEFINLINEAYGFSFA